MTVLTTDPFQFCRFSQFFFRKTRVYDFLQDNKLLLDTQFGFRKNQSCQTALITLTEEIYNAIQSGNLFGLLQLDLFNHTLLLEKLKLYHCNANTICWFQS